MSTSVTLKSLFQALQKEMISNAELSRQLDHPTDKGDNTEISWVDWFKNTFLIDMKLRKLLL